MKIQLRFFASLREQLGQSDMVVETQAVDVAALRDELAARGGVWADTLGRARVLRAAVNHHMVPESATLTEGAEVAFFPPVTGG